MNRKELIESVHEDLSRAPENPGITKSAIEHVLIALANVAMAELLGHGEVPLAGLGKLKVKQRRAHKGRNPRTGAPVDVPAKLAVIFVPGKEFKEALKS